MPCIVENENQIQKAETEDGLIKTNPHSKLNTTLLRGDPMFAGKGLPNFLQDSLELISIAVGV
jgi:hypothetical protein